jgi:hypothetical protein
LADPRYRAAAETWSACMSGHGFAYRDPVDLRERFTPASDADERRIAGAEADCVARSGLADTGRRLDREVGAPVRARYAGDIRAHRELQAAALSRAAALVNTSSTTGTTD